MKRIQITESQLRRLAKMLKEMDVTNKAINVETPTSPNGTPVSSTEANNISQKIANATDRPVQMGTTTDKNGNKIMGENFRVLTKRQLKEARRNKLMAESKKVFRKKDFKK